MAYQLLFIKGPDEGRTVPLEPGQKLLVGRGESCQLAIHDAHVSRSHCKIEVRSNEVILTDAGSKYGTLVNGIRVEKHQLSPGDRIALGETEIRFCLATDPADATVPPKKESPVVTELSAVTPIPAAAGSDLRGLVGRTIERYQISDVIARGMTGTIFRAHDNKYNRLVALKILYPELSDDDTEVARFIRAMKTMLPIKHENIVRLYGAGKSGGYCWTAMELIEGPSVAGMIEKLGVGGMLDWEFAFRISRHIARALEVAHEHKIVHRNITPSNILVRDSDRVAKLGDLMLAKALEGTRAETITRAGELVGQLAYMSPEEANRGRDIDTRADIYKLGVTVYRLVAGRNPFEAPNTAELLRKIREGSPVPPTKYQLSVAPLFEGVILKMLAADRNARFQNPTQLLRDLDRVAEYQGLKDA